MNRRLLSLAAIAAGATVALGASYQYGATDYSFPSSNPPANVKASDPDVKQYVTFIFDDNGYTGAKGSKYEADSGKEAASWAKMKTATGDGEFGLSWAQKKLGSKKNKDGSAMHFTFNMITGATIPVTGKGWQDRASDKFGSYQDPAQPWVDADNGFKNIARAWGREYKITDNGTVDPVSNFVVPTYKEMLVAGHEIGNHTVDHMESNSPLPKDAKGFGLWNNEGFDPSPAEELGDGGLTEEELFGLDDPKSFALTAGWALWAGKKISMNAWSKAIKLAEDQLVDTKLTGMKQSEIFAFRAPRLETNSNQFFALKEQKYQYDCGLEEGYDNINAGGYAWWPYTLDNGTPNGYIQKQNGEVIALDSMPTSLWEIPVNCMIVPPKLRSQIYHKHRMINNGSADGDSTLKDDALAAIDSAEWCGTSATAGKVTCFDFNMFILYGMSKEEWVETMKYNLDLRMKYGKAPLQFGCHTDYYTPMYDFCTLLAEWNIKGYGLVITEGWNTYKTRQAALEEFRDYCISVGAKVVSGHELIEACKVLQGKDKVGTAYKQDGKLFKAVEGATGTLDNATVELDTPITDVIAGFSATLEEGTFKSIDHISLDYKTNASIKVQLEVGSNGSIFEALLNNIGPQVNSGKIPLSAFRMGEDNGVDTVLIPDSVVGIQIIPQPHSKNMTAKFSVTNFTVYGAENIVVPVLENTQKIASFAINGLKTGSVSINVPVSGIYSVNVYSVSGQLVRSASRTVTAGANTFNFVNKLAPSLYVVKVTGAGKELTAKFTVDGSM